ncbi:MAG: hypothetical protein HC879_20805, partial [Leptolyngbyaceae cyanobacterium SL_5_9]|nr:hypothetical protein [Leptolyngbyaceae cyanobacterium SL_5_9]
PTEQQGVITISSCNPTQKSWEVEELQQGVFTYALLESMQLTGERSCATVERLGNYLKQRVPELCQRYGKAPAQVPRISVDPIEKQHFILIPQCARQADIDLMKHEGYRLAFAGNLQLAEQMFFRANVAARGMDSQIIDALTEIRIRMRGGAIVSPTSASTESSTARSGMETAATLSIGGIVDETIIFPFTPVQPIESEDDIPLESEKKIQYRRLRNLLKAGNWKQADQETYKVMIQAVGKTEGDWFNRDELPNFPCVDLKTIDRLWLKYSKGKFGFSVQKQIYVECGATLNGQYPGDDIWEEFCYRAEWISGEHLVSYSEVIFDTSAKEGHLPVCKGEICFMWEEYFFPSLALRLVDCGG